MPPLFLRRVPPGLPAALGDRGRRARCTQRPRLLSALGPAAGRGAISLPTVLCPELGARLELSAHGAQRCVPSARPVTVTFRWPGDSWRSPGVAGMAPRAGAFSRLGAPDGLPAARTPRPPQRRDAAGPRGLFLPCVLCPLGRKAARCSVRARSRTLLPNDSSSCLAASVLPFCQSKVVAAPPDPIPVSAEFFWPQRWCLEPGRDSVTGTQARVPHLLPPYLSRAVGLCSTSPLGCAWRSWPCDAGGRARRRSRAAQGCATSMLNLLGHTRFPAVLRISL